MENKYRLVDVSEAKTFIEANWPNDPLLRQIAINLLDKLPRVEQKWIPMTNADRIRALSDEHLANCLMQFTDLDCRIGFCQNLPKCEALLDTEDGIPLSMCEKCLLNWLQQPAEEEK